MISLYDIKRDTETWDDGVPTHTWTVLSTHKMEIQPVRFSAERSAAIVTINLGGESYVPSYRGWTTIDCSATATDRITADSGTTELLILRTYDFEDHKELDLKEVVD